MADLKISQLSAATSLAGTEVVPVVQGGSTKKATIDQILAPASGKGIDFAAAGGDILTIYDEGTWTPNQGPGLTVVGAFSSNGTYTRIGRFVFVSGSVIGATSIAVSAIGQICSNLPFTKAGPSVATGTAFASTLSSKSLLAVGGAIVYSLDAISGGTSISFAMTYEVA